MKALISLTTIILLLTNSALAVDCSTMDSEDNKKLCKMNKRILKKLNQSGGGSSGDVGVLKFYHDDGKCNSKELGRVYVSNSYDQNERACERAVASSRIWGVGYTSNSGEKLCFDISDSNDATKVCNDAMKMIGR